MFVSKCPYLLVVWSGIVFYSFLLTKGKINQAFLVVAVAAYLFSKGQSEREMVVEL